MLMQHFSFNSARLTAPISCGVTYKKYFKIIKKLIKQKVGQYLADFVHQKGYFARATQERRFLNENKNK